MLRALAAAFRQRMVQTLAAVWMVKGWLVFAVDGSRVNVPRTRKNEERYSPKSKLSRDAQKRRRQRRRQRRQRAAVPAAFTILNKTDYPRRYIMNNPARKLTAEPISRDRLPYTRYRMSFAADEVTPDQTQYSLLPVKMTAALADNACRFYFRRQASGNFTELEQSLPVKLLPAINGRRPQKLLISQYNPVGYSTISPEHLDERIRQDVAAGCNAYMLSFTPGWGEMWCNHTKRFHDTTIAAGAQVVLWMDYPLNYGGTDKGHLAWYPDWIQAHPVARGVYYRNTPAWGTTPYQSPYCNQFVISEAGRGFWEIVKKEYSRSLESFPHATLFFSDWEFHNVTKDGGGVHCFCPAARRRFGASPNCPRRPTSRMRRS